MKDKISLLNHLVEVLLPYPDLMSRMEKMMPNENGDGESKKEIDFLEFLKALSTLEIINDNLLSNFKGILSPSKVSNIKRSGRKNNYSVDIVNEQGTNFRFDVPSMNPSDAYFQLSKRLAYRTIPGIMSVSVYSNLSSERDLKSTPVKIFAKEELIYVNM